MTKKKLTIEERVDRLLKEGVYHPEKWAAVRSYTFPKEKVRSWKGEYARLLNHHQEETQFLFEVLQEMAHRLNPPPPPPKVGDRVKFTWWQYGSGCNERPEKYEVKGTIQSINGAYHYIKPNRHPVCKGIVELYPNEFEVIRK